MPISHITCSKGVGEVLAVQQSASRAQLLVAHSENHQGVKNFFAPGIANFSISFSRTAPVIV